MSTPYRDFCKKYKEKLKNDKEIKEDSLSRYDDFRDRITFRVNVYATCPGLVRMGGWAGDVLFNLDAEDLQYLYNKYSKKIKAEMEQNIAKVKDDYKDVLLNNPQ